MSTLTISPPPIHPSHAQQQETNLLQQGQSSEASSDSSDCLLTFTSQPFSTSLVSSASASYSHYSAMPTCASTHANFKDGQLGGPSAEVACSTRQAKCLIQKDVFGWDALLMGFTHGNIPADPRSLLLQVGHPLGQGKFLQLKQPKD